MRQTEGLYRFARFVKYAVIGAVALAIGVVIVGSMFFVRRVDTRAAWASAEHELRDNILQYNEPVLALAHVYVRRASNYFSRTDGILALTPRRLIYIGIEPRDRLTSADAPTAILTREFVLDTTLMVERTRVFAFTAPGVVISRTSARTRDSRAFAANRARGAELDTLLTTVHRVFADVARANAEDRALHEQVAALLAQPLWYRIKRGDALSSIATKFNVTQEQLRAWNRMTNDRVRLGDSLLVKPAGKLAGEPAGQPPTSAVQDTSARY